MSTTRKPRSQAISIHALREEGDASGNGAPEICVQFLSTPSARRATLQTRPPMPLDSNFYPRPPRGGRRLFPAHGPLRPYFYPRPPRGGRRLCHKFRPCDRNFYPRPPRGGRPTSDSDYRVVSLFLSTPSARRATCPANGQTRNRAISIHALREEGDARIFSRILMVSLFLSTPSARRATSQPVRI